MKCGSIAYLHLSFVFGEEGSSSRKHFVEEGALNI
jgi:hypothetical protein